MLPKECVGIQIITLAVVAHVQSIVHFNPHSRGFFNSQASFMVLFVKSLIEWILEPV